MIDYVIVLFGFYHGSHPIRLTMITQYHFWGKPYLYDQSSRCPIQFSLQTLPNHIRPYNLVLVLKYTKPIWLVTSLSYLIFITCYIQSDRSRQLSFIFSVNRTCTVNHVVALSCFGNIPHSVRQVPTIQFWFQVRRHLYNQLGHCLILFSSQIAIGQIGLDN